VKPGARHIAQLTLGVWAALVVSAIGAGGESQQEILKTIIEKTRQREDAFDGFDWRMSIRHGTAGVEGEGGRRWVKSQGRWLWTGERQGAAGQEALSISAWDGRAYRRFTWEKGQAGRGAVWPTVSQPAGLEFECMLGLRFEWPRARLSEILEGDMGKLNEKYPGYTEFGYCDWEVTVKESEGDGGRKLQVVECAIKWPSGGRRVGRYSFAPDLGYACTAMEWRAYTNDECTFEVKYELSDFREVKEGFLFPFMLKSTGFSAEAGKEKAQEGFVEVKTLSLEMPGSFDEGLFTVNFPPGTSVQDGVMRMEYVVGAAPPMQLRDGISQDVEEVGETEEAGDVESTGENFTAEKDTGGSAERPAPEAPRAAADEGTDIGKWAVAAVIAAVVAIVIVLWRRKEHS
jgi:hypothetical protein